MRGVEHWLHHPGNLDVLHLSPHFSVPPGRNSFGLPELVGEPAPDIRQLSPVAYDRRQKTRKQCASQILHFFIDDYRFEILWHQPSAYLEELKDYAYVCAPDFSCFVDWPWAVQLWNVYRSRWLGAYWQRHGVRVLPTVTWGNETTLSFAYLGLPENSTVAIAVPDMRGRRSMTRVHFHRGYVNMLDDLQPNQVLILGRVTRAMVAHAERRNVRLIVHRPDRPFAKLKRRGRRARAAIR